MDLSKTLSSGALRRACPRRRSASPDPPARSGKRREALLQVRAKPPVSVARQLVAAFDPISAATRDPFGLPSPVQASQPALAEKLPLLPSVMSRSAVGLA
jgi:hypothetical protein